MRAVWLSRLLLFWALVLATLWVARPYVQTWMVRGMEPRRIVPAGDLAPAERNAIQVFSAESPAVALIVTQRTEQDRFGRTMVGTGTGSGFVWDAAGHIVTNNHVIDGARLIGVRLGTERTVRAELVGTAPDYDIAVLRPTRPLEPIEPIPLGSSHDLAVGQRVYAIGNPFGLSRSMSVGVISALDRHLPTASGREIRGVIQTDAAINPGNSGGPLLDSSGRLIGVNTAILSQTGSFAGIGFAVPIDVVNEVVPQLIRQGRTSHAGIGIAALDETATAGLDLPAGIVVADVLPHSPADHAGLKGIDRSTARLGDVITQVNGARVRSVPEFAAALTPAGIGTTVELTVSRDGVTRTVAVQVSDLG
ncbi:MAG: trypsin-like peptidase domain-containing protein [Geminicoccaceae bacterium]